MRNVVKEMEERDRENIEFRSVSKPLPQPL